VAGESFPRHYHPLQNFAAPKAHNEILQGKNFLIGNLLPARKFCISAVHAAGNDLNHQNCYVVHSLFTADSFLSVMVKI